MNWWNVLPHSWNTQCVGTFQSAILGPWENSFEWISTFPGQISSLPVQSAPCTTPRAPSWPAPSARSGPPPPRGLCFPVAWPACNQGSSVICVIYTFTGWPWWIETRLRCLPFASSATTLPIWQAISAQLSSAQAETGRKRNQPNQSQRNVASNHHGHPAPVQIVIEGPRLARLVGI